MLPLLWEFPGGKVEENETDEEALVRELKERLFCRIAVRGESMSTMKEYEKYTVDFHVYSCDLLDDHLKIGNCRDYRWVGLDEFENFEFPSADQDTVDKLLNLKK